MSSITAAAVDAKYLASDADLIAVEQRYTDYENELKQSIDEIADNQPGYGDYQYNLAGFGHDPYVLVSMCSAVKPDFQANSPEIERLFSELKKPHRQYTITTREETLDGKPADSELPLSQKRLVIKQTNYSLSCTVDSVLNIKQLAAYAGYMRSHGGRPDLFPIEDYPNASQLIAPSDYRVPAEIRKQYPLLDRQLKIAEPFLGYPYVWSGSSPETSFDCSGFMCYILDQLGLKYRNQINSQQRRLAVAGSSINGQYYDGIYDKCQPVQDGNQVPGDLVFFTGTFDASYRRQNLTHVGIYCGNDMFIGSNSSIGVSYVSLDHRDQNGVSWRNRLVCYGRLPYSEDNNDENE